MEPSCPLGTTRCISQAKFHQKPYKKSFIDQVCSVQDGWILASSLGTSTSSRFINTQKKERSPYPAILTSRLVNNPYVLILNCFIVNNRGGNRKRNWYSVFRSKRRCVLTLTFIVKSVSKNLLIRSSCSLVIRKFAF